MVALQTLKFARKMPRWRNALRYFMQEEVAKLLEEEEWTFNDAMSYRNPFMRHDVHEIVTLLFMNKINLQQARMTLRLCWETMEEPELVIRRFNIVMADDRLDGVVEEVLQQNQVQVYKYKSGNRQVLTSLVGFCMKKVRGRANSAIFKRKLSEKLKCSS